ncbi:MAG TPA: efflux RND transporter periplasmic adaptor subunit, partial [Polyangiaceae bacterium]|nr:efflux RND transporter periplasmic adaptor subunit [Polyangiaceae bacterium]
PQSANHAVTDDLGFDLPEPATVSKSRIVTLGVIAIGVLGAAFLFGYLPKHHAQTALVESSKAESEDSLRVEVVTPKTLTSDHAIVLTGSIRALEETVIYPRADGYIKAWLVDIGDKVKEGQTLAVIETPELDQQLDQARAQLAQAQAGVLQAAANHEFSKANLERFKQLVPAGVASQQDLDKGQAQSSVDEAGVTVAKAAVNVQEANMRRLSNLKSFANVTAPFAGTITSRTVDRGALVSAGNATPLFKVAATDPARVLIQVPQDVASGIKTDLSAKVSVREFAGRTFDGIVAHSAGALDPGTRTMLVEVRVPNPKNELLAGMYSEVALTLPSSHRVFEVPATALMNDSKGLRVAIVDSDNKLHLQTIAIERDAGATVQVSSGLTGEERIVKIASAELTEGRVVEIRK